MPSALETHCACVAASRNPFERVAWVCTGSARGGLSLQIAGTVDGLLAEPGSLRREPLGCIRPPPLDHTPCGGVGSQVILPLDAVTLALSLQCTRHGAGGWVLGLLCLLNSV